MNYELNRNIAHLCYLVKPPVHDYCRRVGSENNLHVWIHLRDKINQPFLPFYMQAYLRLVHKEHIGLLVFHQHREQDGQDLLLT